MLRTNPRNEAQIAAITAHRVGWLHDAGSGQLQRWRFVTMLRDVRHGVYIYKVNALTFDTRSRDVIRHSSYERVAMFVNKCRLLLRTNIIGTTARYSITSVRLKTRIATIVTLRVIEKAQSGFFNDTRIDLVFSDGSRHDALRGSLAWIIRVIEAAMHLPFENMCASPICAEKTNVRAKKLRNLLSRTIASELVSDLTLSVVTSIRSEVDAVFITFDRPSRTGGCEASESESSGVRTHLISKVQAVINHAQTPYIDSR